MVGFLALGLVLANATIFMTMPWLQAGAWADTEHVVAALHASGALILAGIAVALYRGVASVRVAVTHPLTLLPLGLAAWSVVGAVAAEFPGLALLGPPQTGQGVLWYVDLATFTAAFLSIRDYPGPRRMVVGSLIAVAAAAAFINLRHLPSIQPVMAAAGMDPGWSLFSFNDYEVYYALPLIILGVTGWRHDRVMSIAAITVGIAVLLAANNRTALVAAALVTPPTVLAMWIARRKGGDWMARPLMVAALAAMVAAVALVPYPLIRAIPPDKGFDTLWSRAVLGRAIEPSLSSLQTLTIGKSWGHYQQEMVRNIDSAGVRLYRSEWRDLSRDEFHSHNAALEGLLSAGVPGMVLTVLMALAVVVFAAPKHRVLAAGAATFAALMDALWFQMPVTLAGTAMVGGTLAAHRPPPAWIDRRATLVSVLCLAVALAGAAGAAAAARHALAVDGWKMCLPPHQPGEACASRDMPADPRQSGVGLASVLNDAIQDATDQAAAGKLSPQSAAVIRKAVATAADRAPSSGLSLALAANNAYSLWIGLPPGTPLAINGADFARWGNVVQHLQASAPQRADLIIPYVTWLMTSAREAEASAVVASSERTHPKHPVVLWFRGLLTLGMAGEEARLTGLAKLKTAIQGGVERYLPVEAEVKAALLGANGGQQ